MKNLAKKVQLWSLLLLGSSAFVLSSCGNGELTKGKAEDALEDGLVMFKDSSQFDVLPVGYFQIDDKDAREQLQKLANAGMITYKANKVIEHKKYSNYSYFGGRTYTTRDIDHYFATVSLTPEGEKFVITDPVVEIVDKDMENKNKDKNIDIDALNQTTTADSIRMVDSIAAVEAAAAEAAAQADDMKTQAPEPKSEYQLAQEKQSYTTFYMLSHKNKIVKIKDVYCPEELLKHGKGSCDYIYENVKVTPFGRILGKVTEGERHKKSASFIHYIDRGWCVDKN